MLNTNLFLVFSIFLGLHPNKQLIPGVKMSHIVLFEVCGQSKALLVQIIV